MFMPRWVAGSTNPHVLTAMESTMAIGPHRHVPVWTYNQSNPGPEIRVRQGDILNVQLVNHLEQATAIHWHGIRIDNRMDGVPDFTQKPVNQGDRFDYSFSVPDAGTYWYHSHVTSSEQVARGLYGVLIVEESEPYAADRELTLVVDDWRLNQLGEIDPSFGNMHDISHGGRLGNWITVNGKSTPEFPVSRGERVRLRIVNTSNSRIMTLQISDHQPWTIALDGQPYGPVQNSSGKLTLAPAQRADLIVDFNADIGAQVPLNFIHDRGVVPIAQFIIQRAQNWVENRDAPPPLPGNPIPTMLDEENAFKAELQMSGGAMGGMRGAVFEGQDMDIRELVNRGKVWAFNGVIGPTNKPFFSVKRGQTVIIDMINDNRWPHAMHIHGHHFRVIEANGKRVDDSPWRDTTLLFGMDRSRIAFVADNPGKWLLHCHMLEHQVGGMATWFEVT